MDELELWPNNSGQVSSTLTGAMKKIRKIGKLVKDAWLMIGITILLLCVLEGGRRSKYIHDSE